MRAVDCCPACGADALRLWHDVDGDEMGVWDVLWFACDDCGQHVRAEHDDGEYVPVVEDDEEVAG